MNNHPKLSLVEHFQNLPDPRIHRQREHDLVDIMVIAVCPLICVGETFNDMEDFGRAKEDWFGTFLRLPNGIPSHDTFNRVFAAFDPKPASGHPTGDCGPGRQGAAPGPDEGQNVKYIVTAWAENNGLVLGQLKVAYKSNEITALPELLRVLELSGCIVATDAMGCQKKVAREIVEADADYVLALKGCMRR
jgi:hypothetical protein